MNWQGGLRRLIPYLVAAAGGFFTAYLIVFFLIFPSDLLPDEGKVPNVVGLLYDDAERRLFGAGYKAAVGDQVFHATSPKGTVLTQLPPGGTREQKGVTITLDVSAGPRIGRVPNVAGQSREQAIASLESAGFDLGDITEQPSPAPAGTVLSSQPEPGSELTLPTAVSIVVSAGQANAYIPDVSGHTLDDARAMLEPLGLAVETETDTSATSPGGTVTSQSLAAGSTAPAGTRILLKVSGRVP